MLQVFTARMDGYAALLVRPPFGIPRLLRPRKKRLSRAVVQSGERPERFRTSRDDDKRRHRRNHLQAAADPSTVDSYASIVSFPSSRRPATHARGAPRVDSSAV